MVYDSKIEFTLDTICPWTYIAKRRLERALSLYRSQSPSASKVSFTLHYSPYLLYPDAPAVGEDKRSWYLANRYNSSTEQLGKYEKVMGALGLDEGINFDFGGEIAGTFEAHRVVQEVQRRKGGEVAGKVVDGLYKRYFEETRHPSSEETLVGACVDAGVPEDEARQVVEDKECGLDDVKEALRETKMNGVDAVPVITVEGRRRDFTHEGAKSVEEYLKCFEQVAKESS